MILFHDLRKNFTGMLYTVACVEFWGEFCRFFVCFFSKLGSKDEIFFFFFKSHMLIYLSPTSKSQVVS